MAEGREQDYLDTQAGGVVLRDTGLRLPPLHFCRCAGNLLDGVAWLDRVCTEADLCRCGGCPLGGLVHRLLVYMEVEEAGVAGPWGLYRCGGCLQGGVALPLRASKEVGV